MSKEAFARAEKLGGLIREARQRRGLSEEECALVLGLPAESYRRIEDGEQAISLPELELMAIIFDVPMAYFWGNESLSRRQQTDYAGYKLLRQRIVGALLAQARLTSGKSQAELADQAGLSADRLAAYEAGIEAIPFFDLEKLAACLDLTIRDFASEKAGPLARHEAVLAARQRLAEMPVEVRSFVSEPINQGYLETAMRLSEMDVDKLRAIAEGILEITY